MGKVWEFIADDLEVLRHKIGVAKGFAETVREDTVFAGFLSILDKDIADLLEYYPKEYFNGKISETDIEFKRPKRKCEDIKFAKIEPLKICECCEGVIVSD
jgi:hypothetical protein